MYYGGFKKTNICKFLPSFIEVGDDVFSQGQKSLDTRIEWMATATRVSEDAALLKIPREKENVNVRSYTDHSIWLFVVSCYLKSVVGPMAQSSTESNTEGSSAVRTVRDLKRVTTLRFQLLLSFKI